MSFSAFWCFWNSLSVSIQVGHICFATPVVHSTQWKVHVSATTLPGGTSESSPDSFLPPVCAHSLPITPAHQLLPLNMYPVSLCERLVCTALVVVISLQGSRQGRTLGGPDGCSANRFACNVDLGQQIVQVASGKPQVVVSSSVESLGCASRLCSS